MTHRETAEGLLPCPFCGGDGETHRAVGETWVLCKSCKASGPGCSAHEAGIAAWNLRAQAETDRAMIRRLEYELDTANMNIADFGQRLAAAEEKATEREAFAEVTLESRKYWEERAHAAEDAARKAAGAMRENAAKLVEERYAVLAQSWSAYDACAASELDAIASQIRATALPIKEQP